MTLREALAHSSKTYQRGCDQIREYGDAETAWRESAALAIACYLPVLTAALVELAIQGCGEEGGGR